MKYEDFDKLLNGIDKLSNIKIRDHFSPIPRGYNILGRAVYLILISADGSSNLYFDGWKEVIPDDVVVLYLDGIQVGAIGIKDMEVEE